MGYDRRCRDLPPQEQKRLIDEGKPHVVRLKIPDGRKIAFDDMIRGKIEYDSAVLDDLVLLKSDGFPTYHLANVVDDHHMKISHVLRGEEWIASTPRHVLLYEAFGWEKPKFAHMPVILSPGGGKLSKRKGAASVMDFRRAGYLPEALFNFLALLGWAPGDDREKMPRGEIIAAFSLERVTPKAAVFDEKKLEWLNGLYLAERPAESVIDDVLSGMKARGFVGAEVTAQDRYVRTVVDMMKSRSKRVEEIAANAEYFFRDPSGYEEKAAKKHFGPSAADFLSALAQVLRGVEPFTKAAMEPAFREHAEKSGLTAGALIHPARLAVSGVSFGPGLFEMLEVLGKDVVIRRIDNAVEWIKGKTI
jgi:glutamyl-tRNA synthetase